MDAHVGEGKFHRMPRVGCARAAWPLGPRQMTCWQAGTAEHCAGYSPQTQIPNPSAEPHVMGEQTDFLCSQEYPSEYTLFWMRGYLEQVEFFIIAMQCSGPGEDLCLLI